MPVERDPSISQRSERIADESDPPWAIQLGSLGHTRLNLSYGVIVATVVIVAVTMLVRGRSGNADLPRVVGLGVGFWVAGWAVQLIANVVATWFVGVRLGNVTLGVIGVESAPRRWTAVQSLIVSVSTITSLLLLGSFFRWVAGGFSMPVISNPVGGPWNAPSIGFDSHDSIWESAAWLCGLQAICQMFPLPGTMGRQIYGALASLCSRRFDLPTQVRLFQRCLVAIALMTLLLAIALMFHDQGDNTIPRWPLFLVLGVMLWMSIFRPDVWQFMRGFQFERKRPVQRPVSLIARARDAIGQRRDRRRIERVRQQERSEAVDATRLDEILRRLNTEGADSLSAEDHKILVRVSANLRKQRRADDK